MAQKIKTIFVAVEFIITISIVIVFMFLFRKYNRYFRKLWANSQKYLIGFNINIIGKPDARAKLLVINHQSMLDIIALEAIYPNDIAWAAKKEIFDVFFFGQAVKLSNMIKVDRGDKRAIVQLIRDVKNRLNDGRCIAIFPEGTRGKGDILLKFQSGAKVLAEKLELIVQPIVISNAREVFDSQNFKVNSGSIKVSYMPCINPKDDTNWYENLYTKMQTELTNLLENKENN